MSGGHCWPGRFESVVSSGMTANNLADRSAVAAPSTPWEVRVDRVLIPVHARLPRLLRRPVGRLMRAVRSHYLRKTAWTCRGPNGKHTVTGEKRHPHRFSRKVNGVWETDDVDSECSACWGCCPI